jgi:ATP-dependent RNA helicase RhlE
VATPGRLRKLIDQNYCRLSEVKMIVMDEADTLLDQQSGFMEDLQNGILKKLPEPRRVQYVLVSATLKKQEIQQFRSKFSNLEIMLSPKLHKIPDRMKVAIPFFSLYDDNLLFRWNLLMLDRAIN